MNFYDFCIEQKNIDNQHVSIKNSIVIDFSNSNGKSFSITPQEIIDFIKALDAHRTEFEAEHKKTPERMPFFNQYEEKSYRAIYRLASQYPDLKSFASLGGSQTKELTKIISKMICFLSKETYQDIKIDSHFDTKSVDKAIKKIPVNINKTLSGNKKTIKNNFIEWLQKKGLSEKSIYSYSENSIDLANAIIRKTHPEIDGIYTLTNYKKIIETCSSLEHSDEWIQKNVNGNGMYKAGINKFIEFSKEYFYFSIIPKPFILLAGISGTGKTRFVREQAAAAAVKFNLPEKSNYCLVPVRPDWHEPSDLLGYLTHINGTRYNSTLFLKFVVKALIAATEHASETEIIWKDPDDVPPYWLCLDEMNLAPVEQYFADYLSVIESREWKDNTYRCHPLLSAAQFSSEDAQAAYKNLLNELLAEAQVEDGFRDGLQAYLLKNGIPLPFNLIVAGTVNMDETTHGFSRKVLDRALSFDFGEFFPNNFQQYFDGQPSVLPLTFPRLSSVSKDDLKNVAADTEGNLSINFLETVNRCLKNTPFMLAFRALNELLLAVEAAKPDNELTLLAVWDDFLMQKVLPRIEGDQEKLFRKEQDGQIITVLDELNTVLAAQLNLIWPDGTERPDLFRVKADDTPEMIVWCRSKAKIRQMQHKLNSGFTSFWP
jgi:hypothetical protein